MFQNNISIWRKPPDAVPFPSPAVEEPGPAVQTPSGRAVQPTVGTGLGLALTLQFQAKSC